MGKIVTMSFEGQNLQLLANRLNLYDLKKKLTPEFALTLHVYYHSSQTSLLVYISGLR